LPIYFFLKEEPTDSIAHARLGIQIPSKTGKKFQQKDEIYKNMRGCDKHQ